MNIPATAPDITPDKTPDRRRLLIIPLAALVAVAPLVRYGCSCGHDFDFHLLNWMEAAQQFSHGNLHPHWAFTPAFNAGEPRFVFYPPLSWILGALLGLLLTHLPGVAQGAAWSAAPILFTWIALTLSGLTLYRLARLYAKPNTALLAATLYLANPYMLFTAYERTAYAELLAAAWIPLLFHAILREKISIPGIALPVALLWLTNAPAAVMSCYTLALLGLASVIAAYCVDRESAAASEAPVPRRRRAPREALGILGGTGLGISLAAYYIIPAAYERRYVQIAMATIGGMHIDQNFLFEHTGTSPDALLHDQVLHTASVIAMILLAATCVALFAIVSQRRSSRSNPEFPVVSLVILATGIAFLLSPLSLPLWNHAPQAAFLQFPWRLLAILAVVLAIAFAAALRRVEIGFAPAVFSAILLAMILSHTAYVLLRQPCDSEDTASARLELFHSNQGTEPTDEYTPTNADNDALAAGDPPYWLAASPTDPPPVGAVAGPAPLHLAVTSPRAEYLILNLRAYPSWHVLLNDNAETSHAQRPDGLLALPLPAGPSTLDVRYAQTLDQTVGDIVTLLTLVLLFIVFRWERLRATERN